MSVTRVSLDEQIKEVERELAVRAAVYPNLIGRHKLDPGKAAEQRHRLEAVLSTLRWLQRNEEAIKRALAPADAAQ